MLSWERISDDFKRQKNATCLRRNACVAAAVRQETIYYRAELLVSALPLPFRGTDTEVSPENPRKMASVGKSGFDRNLRYASCIEPQ